MYFTSMQDSIDESCILEWGRLCILSMLLIHMSFILMKTSCSILCTDLEEDLQVLAKCKPIKAAFIKI